MALTREFKDTLMELCKDPEHRTQYRKMIEMRITRGYLD